MSSLKRFFGVILCLTLIYQLLRLGFLYNNADQYSQYHWLGLVQAFLYGIRFDLAAIAMLNAPLAIWFFVDPRRTLDRWTCLLQRTLFVLINTIFVVINLFDLEYFQFTGRRITIGAFDMQMDLSQQLGQLIISYWPLTVLAIIFGICFVWLGRKLVVRSRPSCSWVEYGAVLIVVLASVVVAARGGWQAKPLIAANAFMDSRSQQANLILNSSFTLLKSIGNESLQTVHYFPDWQSVEQVIQPLQGSIPKYEANFNGKKPNVVILILESISREYMGFENPYQGYTPFLDELASRSLFYRQHFANGRRSIDAIPAIIAGIPAWMDKPFITSQYQTNKIEGLPTILARNGYQSYFFHGGYTGTMFFDVMSRLLGFDHYIDASSYPDSSHHDGTWGIFDEPFLKYAATKLDQSSQPFFSTIFTLSSHHPYKIPLEYQGKFKNGSLPIHEAVAYSDFALRQFFDYAKNADWYHNTIFIITADHTSKSDQLAYQTEIGQYRVPLLVYSPGGPLVELDQDSVSQHIDIKPTLLDLLGYGEAQISLQGQSLVRKSNENRLSLLFHGQVYLGITDQWLLRYSRNTRQLEFFDRRDELLKAPLELGSEVQQIWQDRVEAYIQLYHNGLIEDRLTFKNLK